MLPRTIIDGFSYKNSKCWDAVIMMLDASIESEVDAAIGSDKKGEDRIWQCGRADALKAFKNILVETKKQVLDDRNVQPIEHEPS